MALFKRPLLQLVLEGKKTQTRRTHRRLWTVGRAYGIRDRWFTKPEAKILILRRFGQRLSEITKEDARKEGFETLDEFKAAWKEIYKTWNPEQVVIAYEFRLLKAGTPRLI
jgi:hypothetical protein